jgi:hypothetical protein
MRACRHCSHQNADHLGYCSRCGRRLGPLTEPSASQVAPTGAFSRTVLAAQAVGDQSGRRRAMAVRSRLGWAGESIGYIYVFLRGKLDAGERRRRLIEERDGAEALLTGATKELGAAVLSGGVQHPELGALLDAIVKATARRDDAAGDIVASEKLQAKEQARLAAHEAAMESEWMACDAANRDADEALHAAMAERQSAGNRLGRIRDERVRLERDAESEAGEPDGAARVAHLRHQADGLAGKQRTLEEQVGLLDRQLVDLREKSAALRTTAATARSKLDQATAARRQAGSAMAATVAGHARDRADAEREIGELTEQLGRTTAQVRPPASSLLSSFQRIDRLQETISDRSGQIDALDEAQAHYDQRKLLTGVGLLTSMLAATAAALWVALK